MFAGRGRELLARAALARGTDSIAQLHAERAVAESRTERDRGIREVLLARALDRRALGDSAADVYLRAARRLPSVADWLELRAAGATSRRLATPAQLRPGGDADGARAHRAHRSAGARTMARLRGCRARLRRHGGEGPSASPRAARQPRQRDASERALTHLSLCSPATPSANDARRRGHTDRLVVVSAVGVGESRRGARGEQRRAARTRSGRIRARRPRPRRAGSLCIRDRALASRARRRGGRPVRARPRELATWLPSPRISGRGRSFAQARHRPRALHCAA